MKYKIKGKVYNFVEEMPNIDNDILCFKKLIKDTKGTKYILIRCKLDGFYYLYTENEKRLFSFENLKELS